MKYSYAILTLFSLLCLCAVAQAADGEPDAKPHSTPALDTETPSQYEGKITGNWGGARDALFDKGVDLSLDYQADFLANVSGGAARGHDYLDNLDFRATLDGQKLVGLGGNTAYLHVLSNLGGKPNTQVGSLMGVDNIETPAHTIKLYELWDQQNFWNDRVSVLAGLYDLNSEFYATDISSQFIGPMYQIGQELAQTGEGGPSIFPNTSPALRMKIVPAENYYIQTAVIQAPSSNLYGTHIETRPKNGGLIIGEVGLTPKAGADDDTGNKFAIGGWMYTKSSDDLMDVDANGDPVRKTNFGIYALSSYQFYKSEDGATLTGFFKPGLASGAVNRTNWSYELGVVGKGWMPDRPDAEIGLGVAQAHNSHKYIKSVEAAGDTSKSSEYNLELYYRDKIADGITIQPDLQYIVNPDTGAATPNSVVVGLRMGFSF